MRYYVVPINYAPDNNPYDSCYSLHNLRAVRRSHGCYLQHNLLWLSFLWGYELTRPRLLSTAQFCGGAIRWRIPAQLLLSAHFLSYGMVCPVRMLAALLLEKSAHFERAGMPDSAAMLLLFAAHFRANLICIGLLSAAHFKVPHPAAALSTGVVIHSTVYP